MLVATADSVVSSGPRVDDNHYLGGTVDGGSIHSKGAQSLQNSMRSNRAFLPAMDAVGTPGRVRRLGSSAKEPTTSHSSSGAKRQATAQNLSHLGELIGIPNPNVSQNVLISIIEDPIQCGYLYTFCELEHSTENLSFIMEVIRFRETLCPEKCCWQKSWATLDAELGLTELSVPESSSSSSKTPAECFEEGSVLQTWPSRRLDQRAVMDLIQVIWDRFLADHAVTQICMPHRVLTNTRKRMAYYCLYGPEIFGEALLDPIHTLQRDTLPRFLNSGLCTDMVLRIDSLRSLPSAGSIRVQPPTESLLLSKNTDYFKGRKFKLDEILHDKILYNEFLEHLRRSVQSENLLCVRMVEMFEGMMKINDYNAAVSQAWNIYRYFVAPGSAFEVSLYSRHKKELMLSLAKPHADTFEELKKSAYSMLSVNFNNYKFTEGYAGLSQIMKEEKSKALSATRLSLSSLLWPKK